jgi:hypothetical protein
MLQGTLRLLRGGGVEDTVQPLGHLAHPIGGGCRQCVQECGRCGHVLTGPSKGGELTLCPLHCCGLTSLKHQFVLVLVDQPGPNSCLLIGELASVPRGFPLDVVLLVRH